MTALDIAPVVSKRAKTALQVSAILLAWGVFLLSLSQFSSKCAGKSPGPTIGGAMVIAGCAADPQAAARKDLSRLVAELH